MFDQASVTIDGIKFVVDSGFVRGKYRSLGCNVRRGVRTVYRDRP